MNLHFLKKNKTMISFLENLKYQDVCIFDYEDPSWFYICTGKWYCLTIFDKKLDVSKKLTYKWLVGKEKTPEYFIKILDYDIVYNLQRIKTKDVVDIYDSVPPPVFLELVINDFVEIPYFLQQFSKSLNKNVIDLFSTTDYLDFIRRESYRRNIIFYKKCILKYRFVYRFSRFENEVTNRDILGIIKKLNDLVCFYNKLLKNEFVRMNYDDVEKEKCILLYNKEILQTESESD